MVGKGVPADLAGPQSPARVGSVGVIDQSCLTGEYLITLAARVTRVFLPSPTLARHESQLGVRYLIVFVEDPHLAKVLVAENTVEGR